MWMDSFVFCIVCFLSGSDYSPAVYTDTMTNAVCMLGRNSELISLVNNILSTKPQETIVDKENRLMELLGVLLKVCVAGKARLNIVNKKRSTLIECYQYLKVLLWCAEYSEHGVSIPNYGTVVHGDGWKHIDPLGFHMYVASKGLTVHYTDRKKCISDIKKYLNI